MFLKFVTKATRRRRQQEDYELQKTKKRNELLQIFQTDRATVRNSSQDIRPKPARNKWCRAIKCQSKDYSTNRALISL